MNFTDICAGKKPARAVRHGALNKQPDPRPTMAALLSPLEMRRLVAEMVD